MIWFEENPEALIEIKKQISCNYPTLLVFERQKTIVIQGILILHNGSREIDRYSIEILLPDEYPEAIPRVKETSNKIPKTLNRHFYTNGVACLFLPIERYKYFPRGSTIIDFIMGPVENFFLSQTYYDLSGGEWLFGERGHGAYGLIEFLVELLDSNDPKTLGLFLSYLRKDAIRGFLNCYCGSGKKIRFCHLNDLLDWRERIPTRDVRMTLELIDGARKAREFSRRKFQIVNAIDLAIWEIF